MKISNSKKQLAKIIHENGGWRDVAEFAWYGNLTQKGWFGLSKPWYVPKEKTFRMRAKDDTGYFPCVKLKNWHQTILSRDEYFFLYQNQGLEAALDEPLAIADTKPTIEQLATDYRNLLDFALRKQQEADAAKADAEAKLTELVAAGKALGLVLSVADPEPELVLSVDGVQNYTGKFYNAELGEAPAYGKNTRDAVCDGCGKRYGEHYGDRCKSGGER